MTLATRLALIGASSLLAAVLTFALPLPAVLPSAREARLHLLTDTTPAAVCGCPPHGQARHA